MEICDLLENWARWLRSRAGADTCDSVEGGYRRPYRPDDCPTGFGDWSPSPPAHYNNPVNLHQALAVERVMPRVPDRHRRALRLFYVKREAPKRVCQRLGLRLVEWEGFLGYAHAMVKNLLTLAENKCMLPRRTLIPLPSDDMRASTARTAMAKAA